PAPAPLPSRQPNSPPGQEPDTAGPASTSPTPKALSELCHNLATLRYGTVHTATGEFSPLLAALIDGPRARRGAARDQARPAPWRCVTPARQLGAGRLAGGRSLSGHP